MDAREYQEFIQQQRDEHLNILEFVSVIQEKEIQNAGVYFKQKPVINKEKQVCSGPGILHQLNSPIESEDPFSASFDEILDIEEKSILSSPGFLNSVSSTDMLHDDIFEDFLSANNSYLDESQLERGKNDRNELTADLSPEEKNEKLDKIELKNSTSVSEPGGSIPDSGSQQLYESSSDNLSANEGDYTLESSSSFIDDKNLDVFNAENSAAGVVTCNEETDDRFLNEVSSEYKTVVKSDNSVFVPANQTGLQSKLWDEEKKNQICDDSKDQAVDSSENISNIQLVPQSQDGKTKSSDILRENGLHKVSDCLTDERVPPEDITTSISDLLSSSNDNNACDNEENISSNQVKEHPNTGPIKSNDSTAFVQSTSTINGQQELVQSGSEVMDRTINSLENRDKFPEIDEDVMYNSKDNEEINNEVISNSIVLTTDCFELASLKDDVKTSNDSKKMDKNISDTINESVEEDYDLEITERQATTTEHALAKNVRKESSTSMKSAREIFFQSMNLNSANSDTKSHVPADNCLPQSEILTKNDIKIKTGKFVATDDSSVVTDLHESTGVTEGVQSMNLNSGHSDTKSHVPADNCLAQSEILIENDIKIETVKSVATDDSSVVTDLHESTGVTEVPTSQSHYKYDQELPSSPDILHTVSSRIDSKIESASTVNSEILKNKDESRSEDRLENKNPSKVSHHSTSTSLKYQSVTDEKLHQLTKWSIEKKKFSVQDNFKQKRALFEEGIEKQQPERGKLSQPSGKASNSKYMSTISNFKLTGGHRSVRSPTTRQGYGLSGDRQITERKIQSTASKENIQSKSISSHELPPPVPSMPINYDADQSMSYKETALFDSDKKFQCSSVIFNIMEKKTMQTSTFEMRREKELDDILHDLQDTVNKMERDCFDDNSNMKTDLQYKNYKESNNNYILQTNNSVDKPGEEDFVCPPLPPPPSEEDLASYSVESPPPDNSDSPTSLISPAYKASSNFRVWTSGNNSKTNGVTKEDKSDLLKNSALTGFRSVARPVSKNSISNTYSTPCLSSSLLLLNANCNNNNIHNINGLIPTCLDSSYESLKNMPRNDNNSGLVHKTTVNITLANHNDGSVNKTTSDSKKLNTIPNTMKSDLNHKTKQHCRMQNELLNTSQSRTISPINGRQVTLLRDTRHILIKSGQGPGKSTTTTQYTLPNKEFPQTSENVRVTSEKDLPEGAVYETRTIEGNMLHTDTYYPAPGGEKVLERTKKTTIIRAEHHGGIGPTDEQGLPVALRSTVENQKAWYKNMFKQIHKFENEDSEQRHNDADPHDVQDERPVVSQAPTYKPKKLGRITDYAPSDPYIVENKPKKSNSDFSIWRKTELKSSNKTPSLVQKNGNENTLSFKRSPSLEDFIQQEWDNYFDDIFKPSAAEKIPPASTSHKPHWQDKSEKKSQSVELVHGTDYSLKDNFTMADHVVMEPKHVVTMHPVKQQKEEEMSQKKRQPAKAKFNFVAQTNKQMTLTKDQIVIITRDVNKDWYEGQTPDGKHSGMFPVSYVEILNPAAAKPLRRGRARAKFDFKAMDPKQLPLKKGDIVELIEKVDANWYKGCIGQKSGILPSNYLEVEREPEQKPKAAGSNKTNQSSISTKPQKSATYNHSATMSSSSSNSGEPDDKEKMSKASFLANAVVKSRVGLNKPHERRGEFDIPELDDEAMGISHGVNGKHTSQDSYDTTISTTSSSLHSDLGQNLQISSKPADVTSSISSSTSSHNESAKIEESSAQKDVNEILDDGFPTQEKHVALYPYIPQNEDELELKGGDIVQVVEKCDDGWFVGTCERTGAFGTFPGNYVYAVE
ncbi:uncharacterized protein LOC120346901 isoform X3 [Styela clava]